jgi:hypothetical protein
MLGRSACLPRTSRLLAALTAEVFMKLRRVNGNDMSDLVLLKIVLARGAEEATTRTGSMLAFRRGGFGRQSWNLEAQQRNTKSLRVISFL